MLLFLFRLIRNMMGLLGNVAEVPQLRHKLMTKEFVDEFSFLLDSNSDGIEVSYNAGRHSAQNYTYRYRYVSCLYHYGQILIQCYIISCILLALQKSTVAIVTDLQQVFDDIFCLKIFSN